MKFFTTTTTAVFSIIIVSLISLVATAPIELERRDVFVPPITEPNARSVWRCGTNQTVTWDTSNAPENITNTEGVIYLVNGGIIDLANPLATVDIRLGFASVTAPRTAGEYQLLLVGDSGNTSPTFLIVDQ